MNKNKSRLFKTYFLSFTSFPRSKVPKVVEKLTKTQIIKHLLTLARDANKPEVRENCAILLAKLAQKDSRHLERLRELHGIEILHSCMKFIKH